jgi:diguanylate cyclase (GGDEF)-like protein/PAS domain S-box-containing protein
VGEVGRLEAVGAATLVLLSGWGVYAGAMLRRARRLAAHARLDAAALHRDSNHLRSVLTAAHEAYVGMDSFGRVDDWNPAAERLLGWTADEAVGRPVADLIVPEELRAAHSEGVSAAQQGGQGPMLGRSLQTTAVRRDGRRVPVELTIWESWAHGTRRFNAFLRDLTERQRHETELAHLALRDSLTGLPNRHLFADRLEHALSRRGGTALAVLLLDVDGFADVNDELGRSAGDQLLVALGVRLSEATRPSDTLARLGGDEFALLADGVAGPAEAGQLAERLQRALQSPFWLAGRETQVRVSIGIAVTEHGSGCPGAAQAGADGDGDELLRNADIAMFAAKRANAGGFVVFEPPMHAAAAERLERSAGRTRRGTRAARLDPRPDPSPPPDGHLALPV